MSNKIRNPVERAESPDWLGAFLAPPSPSRPPADAGVHTQGMSGSILNMGHEDYEGQRDTPSNRWPSKRRWEHLEHTHISDGPESASFFVTGFLSGKHILSY